MTTDYARIAQAITYLSERAREQPQLEDVAAHVGLSPFHFQRLFRRWAGVTPKQFLQCLTLEHAKTQLQNDASVLDAALDSGLSGPARLHDHFVSLEAVTPGEFKTGGAGMKIRYGFGQTPFGDALLAQTDRGICALSFEDGDAVAELRTAWPNATLVRDDEEARKQLAALFVSSEPQRVRVLASGTNFQVRVWSALLEIPSGEVRTYEQLARSMGEPKSARAVGNALAANSIAVLIPCHRVIQATGAVGNYRWRPDRKRALLAWEAAREKTA